jgi:uncharacterized membrane protein YbhN (UPF0104 family)
MNVIFYGVLFWVPEKRDPFLRLLGMFAGNPSAGRAKSGFLAKGGTSLLKIYNGMRHYGKVRGALQTAMAMTTVVHFLSFASFYFFARAYGESIPLLALGIVVPLGLLVTAIPITPAGVGTGHAAFLWLFALLGSQRGADIFSLFVLATLLQSAIGGLIYLRFKSRVPLDLQPETRPS